MVATRQVSALGLFWFWPRPPRTGPLGPARGDGDCARRGSDCRFGASLQISDGGFEETPALSACTGALLCPKQWPTSSVTRNVYSRDERSASNDEPCHTRCSGIFRPRGGRSGGRGDY